jgi:hypothetical protein
MLSATMLYSLSFFLPTIITSFGYSSDIISNLLTAPVYLVALICVVANSLHSDRTAERYYHIAVPAFLAAVLFAFQAVASIHFSKVRLVFSSFCFLHSSAIHSSSLLFRRLNTRCYSSLLLLSGL